VYTSKSVTKTVQLSATSYQYTQKAFHLKPFHTMTNELSLPERIAAPKPKFWKKVQKIALVVSGVAGTVLALPIALPASIVTAMTILASVAGGIAGASEATVDWKALEKGHLPRQ
jgi:hypothetical protein